MLALVCLFANLEKREKEREEGRKNRLPWEGERRRVGETEEKCCKSSALRFPVIRALWEAGMQLIMNIEVWMRKEGFLCLLRNGHGNGGEDCLWGLRSGLCFYEGPYFFSEVFCS